MDRSADFAECLSTKHSFSGVSENAANFKVSSATMLAIRLLKDIQQNMKILEHPSTTLSSQKSCVVPQATSAFIEDSIKSIDAMRRDASAGGALHAEHFELVASFLDRKLFELSQKFKTQEETKIQRIFSKIDQQKPRKRLVAADATSHRPFQPDDDMQNQSTSLEDAEGFCAGIEPKQLETLRRHQTQMMTLYNKDLESLERAKESLLEISRMHSTIEHHVYAQSEQIERIYDEVWQTTQNIVKGNEQLSKASVHSSDFKLFMIFFLLLASVSLLFLNWYS